MPTRMLAFALTALALCGVAALLGGAALQAVAWATGIALAALVAWALADAAASVRAWRTSALQVSRRLPGALALGVPHDVVIQVDNRGTRTWTLGVFDEPDARFVFEGLPQEARVAPGSRATLRYRVTPLRRGGLRFGAVQLRWRGVFGALEFVAGAGEPEELRVYPNFAAVGRYAWLAGDRRLQQIGIKTYAQRGLGTDFRQLAEYTRGDPLRHIDWKATLRQGKPIVRRYQDERDQRVFFLLDCGRRMRADEEGVPGGSHFDQALNALMLLGYVALKEGDEVGALTFGNAPGRQRDFAPRKGVATLNALMNRLYDLEPEAVHSDYLQAAQQLLHWFPRRALVIVLTNFRDEDVGELKPALELLRKRHLVLVASLRERVLREIASQPLAQPRDAVEAAGAHLFEQNRRDAFARVAGNDALSIDVEPAQLPAALVNRYHAVKRAGLL
ncbi:DUF58 domain-containing protein [Ramlibacter albus]|uniref:DUF58 domain-containing protein n=1 Tax=Ramlibacter albus TaxID=2079448 RepID=A0A923S0X5_9BURK|nr:DUF58 domain-containing protein [Ramlibacter albus]MBC5763700.1 DUF58 domain-containing protein [Ramlibacter albus]